MRWPHQLLNSTSDSALSDSTHRKDSSFMPILYREDNTRNPVNTPIRMRYSHASNTLFRVCICKALQSVFVSKRRDPSNQASWLSSHVRVTRLSDRCFTPTMKTETVAHYCYLERNCSDLITTAPSSILPAANTLRGNLSAAIYRPVNLPPD
jgi:hypothetical protein